MAPRSLVRALAFSNWLRLGLGFIRLPRAANESNTVTISVDQTRRYQEIDGFGFCEAFQRAHSIKNLPEAQQAQVLDLLFNQTTGAGFSIVRVGLGSSPNSTLDHMNSIAPEPFDVDGDPEYVWDRNDSNQVWLSQQAVRYGIDMFYADAWSAPGYMKTNGYDDQGGWLCGVRGKTCESGNWIKAYAEYLVQYVKYYMSEGIPIRYLGFLNEPNLVKPYATMLSDGYQATDVILPLHESLEAANLSEVGIACCEGQGWSMQRELTAEVQAAGGEPYLSLTTTHAYKGDPAAPDRPLNTSHKVWITENSPIIQRLGMTGAWYRNGSENEGLNWANLLHDAFTTGNVSAYVYWIGAGPSQGEAPLIWIPRRNASRPAEAPYFEFAANYFVFAQWSRFIRPGATRISVNTSLPLLQVSAYLNRNGSVVVQVVNNGDVAVPLVLDMPSKHGVGAAEAPVVSTWLTDNAHNMTLAGTQRPESELRAEILPKSLTTFSIQYEQRPAGSKIVAVR